MLFVKIIMYPVNKTLFLLCNRVCCSRLNRIVWGALSDAEKSRQVVVICCTLYLCTRLVGYL